MRCSVLFKGIYLKLLTEASCQKVFFSEADRKQTLKQEISRWASTLVVAEAIELCCYTTGSSTRNCFAECNIKERKLRKLSKLLGNLAFEVLGKWQKRQQSMRTFKIKSKSYHHISEPRKHRHAMRLEPMTLLYFVKILFTQFHCKVFLQHSFIKKPYNHCSVSP